MIRKILLGIGAAFAALFLGLGSLILFLSGDRSPIYYEDMQIVSKTLAPNGAYELIVMKEETVFGEHRTPAISYYVALHTVNRLRQKKTSFFYGTVQKNSDCAEGFRARWKDNTDIEVVSEPFLQTYQETTTERELGGQEFKFRRMVHRRNANCP
jgi:hypothetical protein